MFRQSLLRAARPHHSQWVAQRLQPLRPHRTLSSGPRPQGTPSPERKPSKLLKVLNRWIERVPSSLRGPFLTIRQSPGRYLISFAILHELTAIVPLGVLVAGFHYFHWLPPYFSEGKWAIEGVEKIGRWFRRRGWIGEEEKADVEAQTREGKWAIEGVEKIGRWFRRRGWIGEEEKADVEAQTRAGKARLFEKQQGKISDVWKKNEARGRLLVEVATAYAIVKALVPVRLFVSALWAPWFARQVLARVGRVFKKLGSQ